MVHCVYYNLQLTNAVTRHKQKLSYRRDSARRRSLRRSRSFNVTDVSTNRKTVCDFLLVNNTNLHPTSLQILAFIMALFCYNPLGNISLFFFCISFLLYSALFYRRV